VSEPRKHHYIPVCYLKHWANTADKRLCEHKLIPGHGVKHRRTFPEGTGYQHDLYRAHGLPEGVAQDFEKKFISLVDTDASRAIDKIISGNTDNWTGNLRSGWTRFILSLLFRNPEAVATIKSHIIDMWDVATKALEAEYSARRRASDPMTLAERYAKDSPHAAQIGAANFLAEVIDNQNIGPVIFGMNWARIDLSKSFMQLLTSDRPLDMPLGLKEPNAYIALPVSPQILFIAAHDPGIAQTVRETNPNEIVRKNNRRIVEQARKFVWGTNSSQILFIRRNFGKLPDRIILTEEQRQQAIDAAQGKIPDQPRTAQ
jgi:hypothetical protein